MAADRHFGALVDVVKVYDADASGAAAAGNATQPLALLECKGPPARCAAYPLFFRLIGSLRSGTTACRWLAL